MVSRRNFFAITIVMCVVFFLFQFLNVAKEHLNDYESNSDVVEISQLTSQKETQNAMAVQQAINGRLLVYIGNEAEEGLGKVTSDWCRYRKWTIQKYDSMQTYQQALASGTVQQAWMLLVETADMDWNDPVNVQFIQECIRQGTHIVFSGLPDVQRLTENDSLRELFGVRSIRQERVTVDGIQLYDGLLLGGDIFYQAETEEEQKKQNLQLSFPWYQLSEGTKAYMKGMFQDDSVKAEEYPPVLWRKSFETANVFVMNGDYLEDATGLGLLTGIVGELGEYDIYPVVNAQNLVITDYPDFAEENNEKLQQMYSQSIRGISRDIIWPTLASVSQKNGLKLSCMLSPQLDYADSVELNQMSQKDLNYYISLLHQENGEAGLSGGMVSETAISDKLVKDESFMNKALPTYHYASFYQGDLSQEELQEALQMPFLQTVRTVVEQSDTDSDLFGYATEQVTRQKAVIDGYTHTYRDDLRIRSIESALGYSSILTDMTNVVYPENEEDSWEKLSDKFSSYTSTYWKAYKTFEGTTVSQCDGRIRNFMAMTYTQERSGNILTVNTQNTDGAVWFMLRLHNEAVDSVSGGSAEKIENGFWLIKAEDETIKITLDKTDKLFYYTD